MEKTRDQQTRTESKQALVEHIDDCLRSGDYARVLDLLRGVAAEFPNDAELSELEKRAQDGVKRKAEADQLITASQELFAQGKSAEAIQLLRKAHDLDKNNALSRAILANALVEHANSIVETDWLEAEKLTNQALGLNPTHPTAKTILNLIVDRKTTSCVEEWVSQARKLQSAGDLFGALAWVAEGLAVHPHDPKMLQIQSEIQRDQDARRRQDRRHDLEELRRMAVEIDGAADVAAKQALSGRIQEVAARYWTDGEILSIANTLLLRLGLIPKSSAGSPHGPGAPVIFHVPRTSAPTPSRAGTTPISVSPVQTSPVPMSPVSTSVVPASPISRNPIPPGNVATAFVAPNGVAPNRVASSGAAPSAVAPSTMAPPRTVPSDEVPTTPPEPRRPAPQAAAIPTVAPSAPADKATSRLSSARQTARSNSATLVLVCSAAAIVLVAGTFFFTREHYAQPIAKTLSAASPVSAPTTPAPASSSPAPSVPAPAQATAEQSQPDLPASSDTAAEPVTPEVTAGVQPPSESGQKVGTLLVVAGQDGARVILNGRVQPELTQGGRLRLPNLELRDYIVQVSKSGFQDPPPQKIRIRKGETAKLVYNLQPAPRLASLTIQGGTPGTTVFLDQTPVGTIQPDGALSVPAVNPGDHTVELRKERFMSRQLKEHFIEGGAISLAAADATLEAAPGQLTVTFTPADAKVAIVKGNTLKMLSSGVPIQLAAGTYTLTARTAERFTRSGTFEVIAGQSRTLDLPLAPGGMSKWDDPGAWTPEKGSFIHKGGDFVLYGVVPASGTFVFSAMPAKGHVLQWVLNYTDPRNYVLFQMDDNGFDRAVVRNGQKTDEIKVPDKGDKKIFRTVQIRVSPTEIVHLTQHGESWTVLDRWTQPGANLGSGKFGFYIPGNDEVALSSFAHYADLNIH